MAIASPGKGYEATLSLNPGSGATTIARAVDVELSCEVGMADVSSRAGAGWEESLAALDEWSVNGGQIRVADSDSYETLLTAVLAGTEHIDLVLSVNGGKTRTGHCFVSELNLDMGMGGAILAPFKLQGTDALVFA